MKTEIIIIPTNTHTFLFLQISEYHIFMKVIFFIRMFQIDIYGIMYTHFSFQLKDTGVLIFV